MNKLKALVVLGVISIIGTQTVKAGTIVRDNDTEPVQIQSGGIVNPISPMGVLKQDGILVDYDIPQPEEEEEEHTEEKDFPNTSQYTKWDKKGKSSKYMTFECTAYCNCIKCCGKYSPEAGGKGTTFSGTYPREGRTIAVDPRVIPIGTKVVINGNVYVAEDTGGAIKGNRIDIYFESHERGNAFGRRNLKVKILK